ncbi:Hint domain-containing protein [Aestuariivita sp.]|uniref:Hint domain-containing protein n=1 Tax=Aestuariivita sp. TaxID=1872407 RepID=UPI00216DF934|nr:Hint domain-containing protein [Aestuariivita sp.]MCE8006829.1 Hint domain-containing protein [Aestuariivita sp.]
MSFDIFGIDNEFAASTGDRVNAYGTSSIFDYPPNGSKDLVISTQSGDSDPRLFEIGDTYDLAWGGQGGGGAIQNASVIRSDLAPDGGGGGIIVFEGVDDQGDIAQIIWTPGFDLEEWYWDHYRPSEEPGFYSYDTQPAYSHTYVCFAAETRIATPYGALPVGALRVGHRVVTLDHGPRVLRWVGRRRMGGQGASTPVVFETGALGNSSPLRVSQQHRMMLRDHRAELLFGYAEVLVPAKALVGWRKTRLAPCAELTYIHLLLDTHEILDAEGAPCESLFCGPLSRTMAEADTFVLPDGEECAITHRQTARPVLSYAETRVLLDLPLVAPQPQPALV